MPPYQQKVKTLISRAALVPEEQVLTSHLLSCIPLAKQEETADFLLTNSDWLHGFIKNYRAKRAAIAAGDPALWEQIIRDEEWMLREMAGE